MYIDIYDTVHVLSQKTAQSSRRLVCDCHLLATISEMRSHLAWLGLNNIYMYIIYIRGRCSIPHFGQTGILLCLLDLS